MTERVKIKCDDCKFVDDCVDYGWEGCKKFTPAPSEPLTNEEYMRSCTTEQLAKVIINIAFSEGFDSVRFKCGTNYYCDSRLHPYKDAEKILIKEWLKAPHQE